ncbi:MAG: sugar-binding domain-containing protein [Verrucomicrobiota bacterium]
MKTRLVVWALTIGVMALPEFSRAEDISLNGPWRFAYKNSLPPAKVATRFTVAVMIKPQPQMPTPDQFALDLQVPGYWDEQLSYLPEAPWGNDIAYYGGGNPQPIRFPFSGSGRPRHPDAGRPFVTGVGWYKKLIDVPESWRGRTVTLRVGGARIATYGYVNGIYLDMHHGHDTPFEFDLTGELKYGQTNEIVLAVDNRVDWINSCALRGYQGMSGGIYGDVSLHVSDGPGRILSYYVYPENGLSRLRWKTEITAPQGFNSDSRFLWWVKSLEGETLQSGTLPVRPLATLEVLPLDWSCPTNGIKPWSIWEPNLHRIEVRWEDARGNRLDAGSRTYGLRQLESREQRLYLNGRPILLRGLCDMYFFAPYVHPPNDVEYFRHRLQRLKEVGFNYVRFHTWVPMEPYMQAADEVGMLMGPEHSLTPNRNLLDDGRWSDMVRSCRYHPSVVTYSGGNEEVGHEGLIAKFAERYRAAKALAPDALIIPMHTMSGPESKGGQADLPVPDAYVDKERYYDNLWSRVARNSDLFAARANDFSYQNFLARDWRQIEPEYTNYNRPIIAHESGIIGTYLDLSLEARYTESLPGDLYAAAREYIKSAGRLDMAPTYFQNSARWHGQARKFMLENLRKCNSFDGYDLLGAWDGHWHNSGYSCGLLNEFFEFKPGDTLARVLQYNGESVVLLDNAKRHVFKVQERFDVPVMASLFGGTALRDGVLNWQVRDGETVLLNGKVNGLNAPDGAVTSLANVQFDWPALKQPRHLILAVALNGAGYHLTNQWDFWVFPDRPAPTLNAVADPEALKLVGGRYTQLKPLADAPDTKLRIVRTLTKSDLKHLTDGGDVLLLGAKPFPANETRFQIGVAGRAHMNLATVIQPHPALKYLPNAGWCDWQFHNLLEHGECIEFNKIPAPFDPIVEIVSSYKYIRLQTAMWEARTDGGRLFVASFNFQMDDPAAVALLDGMLEYCQSSLFQPRSTISITDTLTPVLQGVQFKSLRGNDGNFYPGKSIF